MSDSGPSGHSFLEAVRGEVDASMARTADAMTLAHPGRLGAALAYALRTRGKRVRPALLVASHDSIAPSTAPVYRLATAVEIVHTYSLVHDDLPCMDDDAQRRGRPTTHVAFDVALATRAAWLLVPVAIEELIRGALEVALPAAVQGRMAEVLLEAGGVRGMIAGQWLDLAAEGRVSLLDDLVAIHRAKTGALIEAACLLGAIAAGGSEAQQAAIGNFGRELGLAFQIGDDVLDATATTAALGKTAGRDAALRKSTYVSLLGVDAARRAAAAHAEAAVDALAGAGIAGETLTSLARYIVLRTT